jgi:hypothetical protein
MTFHIAYLRELGQKGKRKGQEKKNQKTLNGFSMVASNHGKDPILILIKSGSQSPNLTFPGLKTLSFFSITSNHGKDPPC